MLQYVPAKGHDAASGLVAPIEQWDSAGPRNLLGRGLHGISISNEMMHKRALLQSIHKSFPFRSKCLFSRVCAASSKSELLSSGGFLGGEISKTG